MPIIPANNIEIRDEGSAQGQVRAIDFTGAGVSASVSGSVATVTVSGGGSGSFATTDFTKDLGAANYSGTFDITGLSGLTTNNNVTVMQTAKAISSKGNARDEPEMDQIQVTGYVVDANTIRCYWNCRSVVVGTYAFAYVVG